MISVKKYPPAFVTPNDVFAFLGVHKADAKKQLENEICSVISELLGIVSPRLCYSIYPLSINSSTVDLGFTSVQSADLAKCLLGCTDVIAVCATVGLDTDRLIAKYSRLSPSRALILQAAGAASVEALLDTFENELKEDGYMLRPRFSCGYGDLPLTLQKNIFAALDCQKNIGVSLTDSMLMTPTKSVSALIGVEKRYI